MYLLEIAVVVGGCGGATIFATVLVAIGVLNLRCGGQDFSSCLYEIDATTARGIPVAVEFLKLFLQCSYSYARALMLRWNPGRKNGYR